MPEIDFTGMGTPIAPVPRLRGLRQDPLEVEKPRGALFAPEPVDDPVTDVPPPPATRPRIVGLSKPVAPQPAPAQPPAVEPAPASDPIDFTGMGTPIKAPALAAPKAAATGDVDDISELRRRFVPHDAATWSINNFDQIGSAYFQQFKQAIPTRAFGQGHVHNSSGWDHRNAVDIGINPNTAQGKWLVNYLVSQRIPFQAFNHSAKTADGRTIATGPHVHIGMPSHRTDQQFAVGTKLGPTGDRTNGPSVPGADTISFEGMGTPIAGDAPAANVADAPAPPDSAGYGQFVESETKRLRAQGKSEVDAYTEAELAAQRKFPDAVGAPEGGQPPPHLSPPAAGQRDRWAFANPDWQSQLTRLPTKEEQAFQSWAKQNKITITDDYDMRGFWKGLQSGDPVAKQSIDPNDNRMHFPDKWKTPRHQTFSNESIYATKPGAPGWNEQDQLVEPDGQVMFDDRDPKQVHREGNIQPLPPVVPSAQAASPAPARRPGLHNTAGAPASALPHVQYWLGISPTELHQMSPDQQKAAARVALNLHDVDLDRTKNKQALQPRPTAEQQAGYRANAGIRSTSPAEIFDQANAPVNKAAAQGRANEEALSRQMMAQYQSDQAARRAQVAQSAGIDPGIAEAYARGERAPEAKSGPTALPAAPLVDPRLAQAGQRQIMQELSPSGQTAPNRAREVSGPNAHLVQMSEGEADDFARHVRFQIDRARHLENLPAPLRALGEMGGATASRRLFQLAGAIRLLDKAPATANGHALRQQLKDWAATNGADFDEAIRLSNQEQPKEALAQGASMLANLAGGLGNMGVDVAALGPVAGFGVPAGLETYGRGGTGGEALAEGVRQGAVGAAFHGVGPEGLNLGPLERGLAVGATSGATDALTGRTPNTENVLSNALFAVGLHGLPELVGEARNTTLRTPGERVTEPIPERQESVARVPEVVQELPRRENTEQIPSLTKDGGLPVSPPGRPLMPVGPPRGGEFDAARDEINRRAGGALMPVKTDAPASLWAEAQKLPDGPAKNDLLARMDELRGQAPAEPTPAPVMDPNSPAGRIQGLINQKRASKGLAPLENPPVAAVAKPPVEVAEVPKQPAVTPPDAAVGEVKPTNKENLSVRSDEQSSVVAPKAETVQRPADELPIRAFHGTPHDIEGGFDMQRVGTGEGAQAYGHGLYFTGTEGIAEGYRKTLSYKDAVRQFREELPDDADIEDVNEMARKGQLSPAAARVVGELDKVDWLGFDYPAQAITAAFKEIDNFDPTPELRSAIAEYGNRYEVELKPRADEFLLHDRPLTEQSEKVKAALAKVDHASTVNSEIRRGLAGDTSITGKSLYKTIARISGPKAASEMLHEVGIRGIKYLDGKSRKAGEGAYNYVVFNDKDVSMVGHAKQGATLTEGEKTNANPVESEARPKVAQLAQRPVDEARALTVKTPKGTEAKYEPKVVNADDLITSTDPRFPQELQTKDIAGNKASQVQISAMAGKLDPDLLDHDVKAGSGRPLVVPVEIDGETKYAVVSGNHRTEAIRGAYEAGKEPGQRYEAFARGKEPGTTATRPVHVGVLDTSNLDVKQFAREANAADIGQHNPVESAFADADRLDSHAMSLFVPSEDGSIHGAANRKFLTKFFDGLTDAERRTVYQENGEVSNAGLERVKNALIAKAFGDSKGLVERIISSPDNDIKRVTNALLSSTGKFVDLKQRIADGSAHPELDITADLTKAVQKFADLKRDGAPVTEYLSQHSVFGDDLSPFQKDILRTLDQYRNSSKALSTIFDGYLHLADEAGDPRQQGFLGGEKPDAHSLFEGVKNEYEANRQSPARQVGLTARTEVEPKAGSVGERDGKAVSSEANAGAGEVAPWLEGKPVETQFPYDEPAPEPAAKERSGERGAVSADLLVNFVPELIRRAQAFVSVEPVPALKEAGLSQEARVHAAARISVPHVVKDLLAKVFPDDYLRPAEMAKTVDILNKDNILGGYNEFLRREQVGRTAGDSTAAAKWQRRADAIGTPMGMAKLHGEVRAAVAADPAIAQNIARWNEHVNPYLDTLYNKMKGVDANTPREGRGLLFGARINLLPESRAAEMAAFSDPAKPMPESVTSNYRNPNAKRDIFDRAAKFTGEYSTDAQAVLTNVLGGRLNETSKLDFYNAIVEKGAGKLLDPGDAAPTDINSHKATRLAVKVPETNASGETRLVEKNLYVQGNIASEVRNVLNTDMKLQPNAISKFLTQIQVAQLADMAAHLKNLHTVLAAAPSSKTMMADIAKKFPGVGTARTIGSIAKVVREVSTDTPAIRAEVAEMAKQGLIRPEYPSTGIQKITKGQAIIHHVDTASRIVMNRYFTKLAEAGRVKDTSANRASFVQQIGEYNDRLMSPLMQKMKQSGLSPFIVAGRNFNRQGIRLITGHPGVEAANTAEAAKFRAAGLTNLVAAVTVPAMINVLTTGMLGGRPGTPLGAIDMGRPEDEKGKHSVIDVAQILGIRRGLRATGLNATIEGLREGQSADEIVGHAISDVVSTASHPWIGPALGFGIQATTGHRLDLRGGPQPQEARNVGGGRQYLENSRVALKNQNAALYGALSPLIGTDAENAEANYPMRIAGGIFKSPASAVGMSDVDTPAMKLANEIRRAKGSYTVTPEKEAARVKAKDLVARADNGEDVDEDIQKAVDAGEVSEQQIKNLTRNKKLSPLAVKVKYMSLIPDALRVWQRASPDEREKLQEVMQKKVDRAKLDPEDVKTLHALGFEKGQGTIQPLSGDGLKKIKPLGH